MELPINAEMLADIQKQHYAVVDNFIPQELADELLADANRLHTHGHFQQH